jgi:hypothetical protein
LLLLAAAAAAARIRLQTGTLDALVLLHSKTRHATISSTHQHNSHTPALRLAAAAAVTAIIHP